MGTSLDTYELNLELSLKYHTQYCLIGAISQAYKYCYDVLPTTYEIEGKIENCCNYIHSKKADTTVSHLTLE